uniref:NTF2 domain-containing protein n=1 Tax=Lygus hesperus TaxID=30085 RepID=A0A0K8SVU6_LYGHE
MLSDAEKVNVIDLLNTIPPEDLLDIARTTTSGIISAENQQEAVRIIVQHAEDVRSLLARKKITKTILFKYLHNKRVPFAAAIDKATLIDATIAFWQKGGTSGNVIQNCIPNPIIESNNHSQTTQSVPGLCDELAYKFCEWFFTKLNEPVVMLGGEKIVDNDFWCDASARITLKSGPDSLQHAAQGGSEVVELLAALQLQHNLYFSPNLSMDGLRAKSEPHGLVVILVCGTIHQGQGQCIGIFEQKFGLIKDPYASDNCKIKTLEINLLSKSDVTVQPVLPPEMLAIEQ